MQQALVIAQGVLLIALLAIVGPFVTLWALNTLFPSLHIPYDLWSWMAVFWLNSTVLGRGMIPRA